VAELIRPDAAYEVSYREAVAELVADGRPEEAAGLAGSRFAAFVGRLSDLAAGIGVPEGFVAGSTFWLAEDREYLGRVDVRHELTDALRRVGGHVGYLIRPSRRRQGYGTQALAASLPECRALGLDRVLVTCDVDNVASRRIIERNGGVLEDVINVPGRPVPTMRWWIDT
jgi:predicted acetyltransferase